MWVPCIGLAGRGRHQTLDFVEPLGARGGGSDVFLKIRVNLEILTKQR